MAEWIALEHADTAATSVTVIDWNLGTACNYSCSYCPDHLHDGSFAWPDYETVKNFCDRAIDHYRKMGRIIFFQFSGGEPTLYKSIERLAAYLRSQSCRVGVISNASRPEAWWRKFRDLLDRVVLTHHIEFVDIQHFLSIAHLTSETIRTHVNVTMLPSRFEECLENAYRVAQTCDSVTLTLKPLLLDFGERMYDYSDKQKRVMRETVFPSPRRQMGEPVRGLMKKVFDDGTRTLVKASHLIVNEENRWKGWSCDVGVELLSINYRGDVYKGVCRQDGKIGHFFDQNLRFPISSTICDRNVCHCVSDIITSKSRRIF